MISKAVLGTIIKDQLQEFDELEYSVPREIFNNVSNFKGSSAFVIKGIRRCGKSTLLKQIIKSNFGNNFYYFNFDDERIMDFKTEDFQILMEVLIELFGKKKNIFFDEIQNIKGWELFINRLLREKYCVFITGSNANLLSKELGTHLTGRYIEIELFPFSFGEFLTAKNITIKSKYYSTEEKVVFNKEFKEYFEKGGMPEVIVFSNIAILKNIFNDIIQKDIAVRYNVREIHELKNVLKYLVRNSGNLITYRSIVNNFNIKSSNTLKKYIDYAEETYIIFQVHKYERKIKRFDKNPRKIYCIDNGILIRNTPEIVERKGYMLENIVAIHLKRKGYEIYYFKDENGYECDFIIPKKNEAIQVCYELNDNNRKREIRGLLKAMNAANADKGMILTFDNEEVIENDGKKIFVKAVWQWLIEY